MRKKDFKAIVPLLVVALILGIFILASSEGAATEQPYALEEPKEELEVPHEDAPAYLEDGEHVYRLTDSERQLVIGVVAAEARGEDLEGMMAVAQTIRDRAITRNQSITEVCLAQYQYADAYTGEVGDMLVDSVMFVFDKGHSPLEYPTTHFYAHDLIPEPDWAADLTCRGTIGGHTFFG